MTKDRFAGGMDCQTCGMHVDHPADYHPWLFCQLYKQGHRDPAAYLESALPGALLMLPKRAGQPVTDTHEIVAKQGASA